MDWTEPALKPIDVLTSTACERRVVYKVLAKKNSLALTLLIPSVEHVSPAASVRAIGVRVELIPPHRRPARSLRRNLGTAARRRRSGSTASSHASTVPVAASPEHAPDGAVRDGRTRAERHPLRDHAAERAHHGPLLRGLAHGRGRTALLRGGEGGGHRLGRSQRGGLVRLHVPPVRLPRGLILDLLPRVLHRRGRRGLAHGPPRSAEPPPSSPGAHLARVHGGRTSDALERDRRISSE